MSSIQSTLMSQPLPLSEAFSGNHAKVKGGGTELDKAAKDMESVFTTMLLNEMRKTLEPGSLFGEDSADVYGGLFDQFVGQHIADAGGLGLAKMVREALSKTSDSASLPFGLNAARFEGTKTEAAKPEAVTAETPKPEAAKL